MENSIFKRFSRFWWVVGIPLVLLVLALLPVGKPADDVRTLHISADYNHTQRLVVTSRSNRRGLSHLPQTVSFETDGAPVRVYLLDLQSLGDSEAQIDAMLLATQEIEQGREPSTAPIVASAVDATEGEFDLGHGPWGSVNYTLVVGGEQTAEITVRVNYGR